VRQGCSPRSESVKVTSNYGYLINSALTDVTSSSARHLQCGSASCPWRLHAEPGQRINLTVVHFSVSVAADHGLSPADAPVVCHRVAAVREAGAVYRDLTACHDPAAAAVGGLASRYLGAVPSRSRTATRHSKPIYWSETNSLQLMFYVAAHVHVILRYEGITIHYMLSRVLDPLMSTLKLHGNGPLYSNTAISTLAVDGWAVTFGTATRCLGGLWRRPIHSSLYQI